MRKELIDKIFNEFDKDKEIIKRNFDNGNNAFIVKIYNN